MMNDTDFEHRVKATLDDSVNALDADTRHRLAELRRKSLQPQSFSAARWLTLSFWGQHFWLPAMAMGLCAIYIAMQFNAPSHPSASQDQVALLELLNNTDDLDTMSDPDFYLWAEETSSDETSHAI
ncbi:MAG: hypothetical protein WBP13_09450 [Methylophilaceae bacterium]